MSKPTTLDDDIESLRGLVNGDSRGFSEKKGNKRSKTGTHSSIQRKQTALLFRIEKKKILLEASS